MTYIEIYKVTVTYKDAMKNARTLPKVMVRLEPEIKDQLEESAQRNFRSLSNEIHMRLAASLAAEKSKAPNA